MPQSQRAFNTHQNVLTDQSQNMLRLIVVDLLLLETMMTPDLCDAHTWTPFFSLGFWSFVIEPCESSAYLWDEYTIDVEF